MMTFGDQEIKNPNLRLEAE